MTWLFEGNIVEQSPEDCVGYVYCITNTVTGRMYIGKKLSKFAKTTYKVVKLKNGTKKRKKIKGKVESDWQDYYGSNDTLKAYVIKLGPENFQREILYYCKTKAECSYIEAREQFSIKSEFDFTKLGSSAERMLRLVNIRKRDRSEFDKYDFKKYKYLIWILAKLKVVPYTFYIKYCN